MISSVCLFFGEETENEYMKTVLIRKYLRDCSNPLELSDKQFINAFRINKDALQYLLIETKHRFRPSIRTSAIPPITKICAALRFFASGSYQQSIGDDFNLGLAQPTVSTVMKEVLNIFEETICSKWIKAAMSEDEKQAANSFFLEKHKFPGTIGCVDGTHVKISTPKADLQNMYHCKNGYFSLNVMIVCDHNMIIRFVDPRHPGANPDSVIWSLSSINEYLRQGYASGQTNAWLLGDVGYDLLPYLITPYRSPPVGSREAYFNKVHAGALNIIKRTIGVLKNRFRCLHRTKKLHYSPDKAKQIVNVCSALHNICQTYKIEIDRFVDENISSEDDEELASTENEPAHAQQIRDEILNSLYEVETVI